MIENKFSKYLRVRKRLRGSLAKVNHYHFLRTVRISSSSSNAWRLTLYISIEPTSVFPPNKHGSIFSFGVRKLANSIEGTYSWLGPTGRLTSRIQRKKNAIFPFGKWSETLIQLHGSLFWKRTSFKSSHNPINLSRSTAFGGHLCWSTKEINEKATQH